MNLALSCWQGRIAPLFDVSHEFLLLRLRDGKVVERQHVVLAEEELTHRLDRLAEAGVELLVCGAVSRQVEARLQNRGMQVRAFRAGEVEEILLALFEGRLDDDDFAMPGCCGRRRRRHGGGRRGGGCTGRGPRCGRGKEA